MRGAVGLLLSVGGLASLIGAVVVFGLASEGFPFASQLLICIGIACVGCAWILNDWLEA